MAEKIPFLTGTVVSTDDFVAIAPNTAVASLTAAERNAKNRVWNLTAGTSADLPPNNYRAYVVVDASAATTSATMYDAAPAQIRTIPGGTQLELWRSQGHISTAAFSFVAGTGGATVTEYSYV